MQMVEFQGRDCPASYLGDGVYAIFDGMGIWLHANDHRFPTDKIYLGLSVLINLNNFAKELEKKEEGNDLRKNA